MKSKSIKEISECCEQLPYLTYERDALILKCFKCDRAVCLMKNFSNAMKSDCSGFVQEDLGIPLNKIIEVWNYRMSLDLELGLSCYMINEHTGELESTGATTKLL